MSDKLPEGEDPRNASYYAVMLRRVVEEARHRGVVIVAIVEDDNPIGEAVSLEVISLGNPIHTFGLLGVALEQRKKLI